MRCLIGAAQVQNSGENIRGVCRGVGRNAVPYIIYLFKIITTVYSRTNDSVVIAL